MTGFTAVFIYVAWTLVLMLLYAFPRVPQMLSGKKLPNAWERSEPNTDPPLLVRAKAAHANCIENFPLFAAVVCIAALMHKSAVVDGLAAYLVGARIAQGVTHLIGTSFMLVLIRATFFLFQVALIFFFLWGLMH